MCVSHYNLSCSFVDYYSVCQIFNRLKALERTIILLDEIEEFCLDRENPNLTMESRMLTTAMLTQVTFMPVASF